MNELLKINYETGQPTVSARDLHEQLHIKTAFKDWFPRMCEYGFEDGKDFSSRDALKEAINNAAKNWIEKCILDTPTVEYASYYKSASRYWSYGILSVKWDPIEDATSYEVCITKEDGAEKVFTTTYNSLFVSDRFDDFVANGMDGATVKVKAYGDGDKFSLWSDEVTVSRFDF